MTQRVFVDANVLLSRTLRDWLFMLRQETRGGIFQLHTTWDVITEAGARLRDNYPLADGDLLGLLIERIKDNVDEILTAFPGGAVEGIADEGDWHVHHAAQSCRADILLTEDKGFTSDDTHYEVYSCDEFFLEIGRSAPAAVTRVVKKQTAHWARYPDAKQLPDALRDAQCHGFADMILGHLKELALAGNP
ncbi:PIN domain-containing protein [Arthrobacter sp.]|uniref:PIN domain-containing protein n=1 Tax=Arthrobacter sp. TaxID=1667 RepID=UPI003A8DFB4A